MSTGASNGTPAIAVEALWQVFGPDAERQLKQALGAGKPAPEVADTLRAAGLIPAVQDASFEVKEGELFVIMGLSGSGKSTMIRCISRLVEPTGGSVQIDGEDILTASPKRLIELRREKLGMVFQHFGLFPHMTVAENVAFPLKMLGKSKTERRARALEVIEMVGLSGREDAFPRELSGGQKQRVGIARSLAANPDIWFLDEPFSALDPLIRRQLQDEFLKIQSTLNKTIVFITHDFDEAIRLADRIAVMKDGAIEQIAAPEELVLNPATDYVAEFTRHVSRAKVIRVGTVMSDAIATDFAGDVAHDATVESIADAVESADLPHRVMREGRVVGQIDRKAVVDVLVGRM